jgi:hypothetical protein
MRCQSLMLQILETFFFLLHSLWHSTKVKKTNNKWGKRMMNLTKWQCHIHECIIDVKSVMVQSWIAFILLLHFCDLRINDNPRHQTSGGCTILFQTLQQQLESYLSWFVKSEKWGGTLQGVRNQTTRWITNGLWFYSWQR